MDHEELARQLQGQINRVLEMHVPVMEDGQPVGCEVCDWEHPSYSFAKSWRCPTILALTES